MNNKSFTLIELLVVIVIIGILAGVIMISTSSSIDKANLAKAQAFSSTVQEKLLSNLVSEWTFDEGVNQTVNRIATNNDVEDVWGINNGTIVATHEPIVIGNNDCIFGKCLSFNGNQYINIPYVPVIKINGTYAVSLWFNNLNSAGALLTISQNSSNRHGIGIESNKLIAAYYNGSVYTGIGSVSTISTNVWHHVVYENNLGNLNIYLDGVDISTISQNIQLAIDGGFIGYDTNSHYYLNGKIDEVRLYSDALSSSEIKQNYIAGLNSMLSNGNISKEEYNERINELAYDK
ncbi:MAG TPA: prepilin-type N-terminal cleavage/methylation domain-containing protein [Candidatus Pacearchaeota archaeon]|nr:prepilin-type N-terminal cleavage/methylation domain-containing protein [Candidatus Pacearchaeota archaeon]